MATLVLPFLLLISIATASCAATTTFTLQNNCPFTIWPATLSGNGAAVLGNGGFELPSNSSVSFPAPPGWSGRFWARTSCLFSPANNSGPCATGGCGNALRCTASGQPPATLAEFTLTSSPSGQDFYDVSLVDGYNVGIGVRPSPTAGDQSTPEKAAGAVDNCRYAGCVADVNARCPAELRVARDSGETLACRSACEAFGSPEYCCTGAHGSPDTCRPTRYSQLFKAACPSAYSYAYDDATSTFTCAGGAAGYVITFCPAV